MPSYTLLAELIEGAHRARLRSKGPDPAKQLAVNGRARWWREARRQGRCRQRLMIAAQQGKISWLELRRIPLEVPGPPRSTCCQWIEGMPPIGRPPVVCGAPVRRGCSYCEAHAAVVFRADRGRTFFTKMQP